MYIELFKQKLIRKEQVLLAGIATLRGEPITAEVQDSTDAATASQGNSESLSEAALESATLVQVQDALQRIEHGTYGKCAECGQEIGIARMEAEPWALFCLADQEKQERS